MGAAAYLAPFRKIPVAAALAAALMGMGPGDGVLVGSPGDDQLDGRQGVDVVDAGPGADTLDLRDGEVDAVWCGSGDDTVRADAFDELDMACEHVDYGPPGHPGRIRAITGGGRFVPIPGQTWALVDRRLVPDVLYLVRRWHVRVGDGYGAVGHEALGEHPLGLAVDLYPGPGGSWRELARLARWAEPRQNRPRLPFRWVGYNGDHNHGRGNHLHLSWMHSGGRPRRPVRTMWTWAVRR
jgi:RTX calcium-binding nonapeptide repeat (4 copies)